VYSHFCSPHLNRFGTVGKALPNIEVKIADDGEIRKKCKADMKGYFKEKELSEAMIDENGFLKTGDIGEYDKDGYLTITGRVKDIFKTDKGKYISPGPIETQILADTNIEQACVVGTGVPQPIVLVTLSDAGKTLPVDELKANLNKLVDEINQALEKFEMLEKVVIMKENWTIANNLITPTLKVKRNEIEKIHLKTYPEWYNEKGKIIWEL
jgi:long-chain acyl-CoA synthetase